MIYYKAYYRATPISKDLVEIDEDTYEEELCTGESVGEVYKKAKSKLDEKFLTLEEFIPLIVKRTSDGGENWFESYMSDKGEVVRLYIDRINEGYDEIKAPD